MNLKNYTSTVEAADTIAAIERVLVEYGATAIQREYLNGKVASFMFKLKLEWGEQIVRMPADPDAAFGALKKALRKQPTPAGVKRLREQAERTAWRLWWDWLRVQLSLLQMQKVSAGQIFMPYFWDGSQRQTLFEHYREGQMKQLAAHKEEDSPATIPMTGTE